MKIELPDLENYRALLQSKGGNFPLPVVESSSQGLLDKIPAAATGLEGWPWKKQVDPSVYDKFENWPKLTIMMPSYNQVKFVEQTIRSVLLQNYPNLEFIVMDGGSNDGSKAILEKYAQWISYWQSEKDEGQSQAINQGFSLASGDYYAWINSDDYYLKDVFQLVVNTFLTTKASFVYGYGENLDVEKNEFKLVKVLPFTDYFIKIPALIQPSCFWSAQIHQPVWEELHCSMDFELWLRLVKGQKRKLIKQPLSVAQVHNDAKTYDPEMKKKWDEDHQKIWSAEAHGTVYEWNRIIFLNRIRKKIYSWLSLY